MLRLAELYSPVAADIERSARIFHDELISDQTLISDLCRHVGQFHGKMLRPALLLLTADACGAMQPEHHTLAAVVEMVHIATLVHDDVLDEADIRRRAATVNRLWGNERAVLMGDFLISHAFHLCSSLDSQYAAHLIGQTTNTVCEGEMMQVANRDNFELSEDEYLDIITRKTAVLIGTCCLLGAKYADADAELIEGMKHFGLSLGIAFQITDDLLDLTGDEAEAGKSLGRDVHKGKLTLPLIHFLRVSSSRERARLLGILRGEDPKRYRQVANLLQDSESVEYAYQTAYAHIENARAALALLPPSEARSSLTAMAEFVITRRR
ncbi:MAG: polyprenyl synthetase family protein [Planctomycetes bacterium]|nr:polyprenyl synthetase family protein [Planctomycetota bacterium]